MNLQTVKPRARCIIQADGRPVWKVRFPGWEPKFVSSKLGVAVAMAYRCRLVRITGRRDA
jgi:hypothetical protein